MNKIQIETAFERWLYSMRWIMAPVYIGLSMTLAMMLFVFARETLHYIMVLPTMKVDDLILAVLTLIDLTLAANLVIVVLFSGYENFVSKLHLPEEAERPSWMGKVDFSALKMKLIASMVAISGIHLLKTFMSIGKETAIDEKQLYWLLCIHMGFCASGVLLATMDYIAGKIRH